MTETEFFDLKHALAVVSRLPADPEAWLVALLHDSVEDGACTFEDISSAGLPSSVLLAVKVITRNPEKETYAEYIERVATSGNKLAIQVKLADLQVNHARAAGHYAGLKKRYELALVRLGREV